jgi:hypothetical protein
MPDALRNTIADAASPRPETYTDQQGWVRIAFQNTLWQLLHADLFRNGVRETVMQGGDTKSNAGICSALL